MRAANSPERQTGMETDGCKLPVFRGDPKIYGWVSRFHQDGLRSRIFTGYILLRTSLIRPGRRSSNLASSNALCARETGPASSITRMIPKLGSWAG